MNTQIQQTIPFKISSTRVLLQDHTFINLDDLTELEDASIFKVELKPVQPFEKEKYVQQDITVERNLDQQLIARNGYTIFDYFSDIGGMQGSILSFVAAFLGFWNYNMLDDYMIMKLFRLQQTEDEGTNDETLPKHSKLDTV